ncbi:MAG: HAD-IA family hydrolase [Oceanospirillaceae bacterium]|nr:HAD-IA family hydrolase [Oceanospirillaceae bacterium]
MVKALFSDLDGVLRHWQTQPLWALEQQLGQERGITFKHAFDTQLLQLAITGEISHRSWLQAVEQSLGVFMQQSSAKSLVAAWYESESAIDFELLAGYRTLVASVPLLLITNATDRLNTDLADAGLSRSFDYIVNSSKLGSAKPAREIFTAALQMVGCDASEAVFIDDSKTNVLAAEQYGFKVIHFQNRDQCLQELAVFA